MELDLVLLPFAEVSEEQVQDLVSAASQGSTAEVKSRLQLPQDPDLYGEDYCTALMMASAGGHVEVVSMLLDADANKELTDIDGCTALMLACQAGHEEVVNLLLKNGANMNAANILGRTVLLRASAGGNVECVSLLLAAGVDTERADINGDIALIAATDACHVEIVSLLLKASANCDVANNRGNTALMISSAAGQVELVSLLLKQGASKDVADNLSGSTALMKASAEDQLQVMSLLLEAGADKDAANTFGRTALMDSSAWGSGQAVQLLLAAGANKDVADNSGETALMIACESGHADIVSMLLDAGANTEVTDIGGCTALTFASEKGHGEVVSLLLKQGANKDVADNLSGSTALMKASAACHLEVMSLLLEAGADKDTANSFGRTALMDASAVGDVEVVRLLLAAGANKDLTDISGDTALSAATDACRVEIVRFLLNAGQVRLVSLLLLAGADRDVASNFGRTALMAASASGNIGVATLRLAAGGNKDVADYRGETALMLASESGHGEVVSMLLREGANREAATYFGRTALMVASSRGLFGIVSLLQEADTVDSTERQELLPAVPELGSKGNSRVPCGVLGPAWQRSLRRLPKGGLLRAAVLLARAERPPEGSGCDASVWPEARRQRMEGVLQQLLEAPGRQDLSTRDWASALWSTARCRAKAPSALLEAASRAVSEPGSERGDVQSSDIARCFWAAASLRWQELAFLEGAARLCRPQLPRCTEQDLSNIAWASATLNFNPSQWLVDVACAFSELHQEGSCSPQAIANVLWSLAKAHEGGFGDEAFRDVAFQLEPAITASLPAALPQHVANILWALAKLGVELDVEGELTANLSKRMLELLHEAEIQHLAMGCWGLARLLGTHQATGPARDFFCRLADHLRRRVRVSDRTWRSRWDGIFLSHVSIICWSYARVLSADKVTRRLLKSASKQLESFTEEGAIKAQEHANLLWAYAQAAEEAWTGMQKPRVMLDGLVQLLCDPKLKLLGESSVSFAASASALARIRPMISPMQQRALGLWMERSSGRLSRRKDFELDRAEVIGLLRALVACSKLQSRMLSCCLKVLQKDCESLAPSQMLVVLLALRTIRPRRLNDEQLWFLRTVQSRFDEFRLPQLALALWRLHSIQEELADGAEMRQMIESGTARFRSARLRWPQMPWRRHAEEPGETLPAHQAEEVDLSMEEWRWLANSALPCPLLHDQGEGAMPWTAELLRPYASWVVAVADEIKTEADLLVSVTSSFNTSAEDEDAVTPELFAHRCLVEETVRQRYRAVLQRDGLAWTGFRLL
ncbi:Ankyrin repeat domain-containing protein 50 [Symbiodinium microadriaticum]|uniref:Ankyrin repeat domain-containing protein 50 n=1 Tax=Symbiodinium microadriaticum TaxID=2951 RepID=A0A1Q9ENG4_SYMMI|nr:Ankyrin repeat domain-containing protein 50 [Symbiodinium microadriaticum]